MEIVKVGEKSFKIKTKNTTFIINPEKKIDGDVIILTSKPQTYEMYKGLLVIDGPGDYEVAGVSIHSDSVDGNLSFDFLEDSQKVLILSSPDIAKSRETESYSLTLCLLSHEAANSLSQIASELIVVVGPDAFLPKDISNIKKAEKINLKRVDEYKGFIVHLSK